MKILVLDAYFEPEQTAFTHLEKDLLDAFVQAGHEIEIVCPTPSRGIDDITAKKYSAVKKESLYGGKVNVTRFYAPKEGKNSFFRALRYFWCNFRLYRTAKRIKGADVIFSNSTPPVQGLVAIKLKKKLKIPFIYDLQDIFPDSLSGAGLAKKGSLSYRIGDRIANKIYAAADRIIVISEDFKKNIIAKGVAEEKIKVVYNWVDCDAVKPVLRADNPLFDEYGLDRSLFYVSYSGNIGRTQNLDLLLNVAKKIENSMKDVRFVLIGDGVERERIKKRIENEKISNIIMMPFQDYGSISQVFSLGDVGLIISKKNVGNNSVPSKTYGYMAAERPILASFDKESQLAFLIRTVDCGVVAESDDEKLFIEAITKLRLSNDMGKKGRVYLLENFSKDKCTAKYVKVLCETISN